MARTREQIEQEIDDAKAANAVLSNITSLSSTSIWLAIKEVVSFVIWSFEKLWDRYKAEVDNSSSSAVYGHDEWWVKKMLEFQYGDSIAVEDIDGKKRVYYQVVDVSKRIIKRASIKDDGKGGSVIKMAKESGGSLVGLSTAEFNAAKSYINKLRIAGSKLTAQSKNTDLARYFITIYYDPLVPLVDIGDVLGIQTNVQKAIDAYHTNIDFDGGIDLRKLEDELQKINGVTSFVTTDAQAKAAGGVYSSFNRRYETISGYVQVDPDYPAKDVEEGGTITYLSNV